MKYKNMKIEITDTSHLKAVCDVLESMGYRLQRLCTVANYVFANCFGSYWVDINNQPVFNEYEVNLTNLLKMRDEMVYQNVKVKKPRVRVQSGQDLTGKIDFSKWREIR